MSDSIQTLIALYKEQTEQARHHEVQRTTITNFVLVITGAVLGLLSIEGFDSHEPVGVFLIGLGIFGATAVAKHYERNRYHSSLAGGYRRRIEKIDENIKIDREKIKSKQKENYPLLNEQRLYRLWIIFHLFVSALGALVIWMN